MNIREKPDTFDSIIALTIVEIIAAIVHPSLPVFLYLRLMSFRRLLIDSSSFILTKYFVLVPKTVHHALLATSVLLLGSDGQVYVTYVSMHLPYWP